MINGFDQVMRYGNDGPLVPTSSNQTMVQERGLGVFDLAGCQGTLDQQGFEPAVALARFARVPFPSTLVVARTDPGPTGHMRI